jgi:hypothetical protein
MHMPRCTHTHTHKHVQMMVGSGGGGMGWGGGGRACVVGCVLRVWRSGGAAVKWLGGSCGCYTPVGVSTRMHMSARCPPSLTVNNSECCCCKRNAAALRRWARGLLPRTQTPQVSTTGEECAIIGAGAAAWCSEAGSGGVWSPHVPQRRAQSRRQLLQRLRHTRFDCIPPACCCANAAL